MPILTHDVFIEYLNSVESVRSKGARLKYQSEAAIVKAQHLRRRLHPGAHVKEGLQTLFKLPKITDVETKINALLSVAFNDSSMLIEDHIADAAWSESRAPVCGRFLFYARMPSCINL